MSHGDPTVKGKVLRDRLGIVTYIGKCCSEWVMAYGSPSGSCGLCGEKPVFDRFDDHYEASQ